ncbi:hypothetical protein C8R43DRAFT_953225 [Mycena crocata]|nr:hypothetical protein C8R43DRAFT_953225 [Mycena crocata]
MPEQYKARRHFHRYVERFLESKFVQENPKSVEVLEFFADMIDNEMEDMQARERKLKAFSKELDSQSLRNEDHKHWSRAMQDLAASIPDTNGLMIYELHNWHILRSGETFPSISGSKYPQIIMTGTAFVILFTTSTMAQLFNLRKDREKPDPNVLMPSDSSDEAAFKLPYTIGNSPSNSGPHASDAKLRLADILSNGCYTPAEAFKTAALRLKHVFSHSRMLLLDLDTVVLKPSWNRSFIPRHRYIQEKNGTEFIKFLERYDFVLHTQERGFKIGFAIGMVTHVLAFLSNDNLYRLYWRSPQELQQLQQYRVPGTVFGFTFFLGTLISILDSVLDYHAWCKYQVKYLKDHAPMRQSNLTIYRWLTRPGDHPFQGRGGYCTAEVLALAGIPASTLAYYVLENKTLYNILVEADHEFFFERQFLIDGFLDRMQAGNKQDEFSLGTSIQDQISYTETLRVHGKKEWHASSRLDSHHGSSLHKTKQWETLLSQIPPDLMTTPASRLTVGQRKLKDKIAARMKLLPNDLSPLQRLSLTPSPCLTPDEISLLKSQFGDINLITKYFRTVEMRFCEVPIRLPTFLHKMGKEKQGKIWTVLRPLFMESKKRVVVGFDPIKDQNITQLVSSGQQLWLEVPDSSKYLIEYVKKHTLGWTVGPFDFCGNACIISEGVRGT